MNLLALIHVRRIRGREPTPIRVFPRARFSSSSMCYATYFLLSTSLATIEMK